MNPKFLVLVAMSVPLAPAAAHSDEYAPAIFHVYSDYCSLDFLNNVDVERPPDEDIGKVKRYFEGRYRSECVPFFESEVYPRLVPFQLAQWDIFQSEGPSILNENELTRLGIYFYLGNFSYRYECENFTYQWKDDYEVLMEKLVFDDVEEVARHWIDFGERVRSDTRLVHKTEMCRYGNKIGSERIESLQNQEVDDTESIIARYEQEVDALVRDPDSLGEVLNGRRDSQFIAVGGSYEDFIKYVRELFDVVTIDVALFRKLHKHYYPDSEEMHIGMKIDKPYGPVDRLDEIQLRACNSLPGNHQAKEWLERNCKN